MGMGFPFGVRTCFGPRERRRLYSVVTMKYHRVTHFKMADFMLCELHLNS